jgi:hypothetical protein
MRVAYARWAEGIAAVILAYFFLVILKVSFYDPSGHDDGAKWYYVLWIAVPVFFIIGGLIWRRRVVRIIGWLWLVTQFFLLG